MTTKIDYSGMICIPSKEKIRFVLKKKGNNPLFVIGLNSSTADENKPDRTVRKAMTIAESHEGTDGFVMFNLYPLRETVPSKLPPTDVQKLLDRNIAAIQKELGNVSNPTILAAWGTNIEERKYLAESLRKIVQLPAAQGAKWFHFGDLTQAGHPRHLLYVPTDSELSKFDVEKYVKNLK